MFKVFIVRYLVPDSYSTAIPTCECNIRCHRQLTRRMSLPPNPYYANISIRDTQVPQAIGDIISSYDAVVDLFASFENFLSKEVSG
jgi:hypothetical protein